MSYPSSLKITYQYQPDISAEALAVIQQTAVEQHAGLEKGADKDAEIYLKSEEIEDILYSSTGYSLVVAYASSTETPDKEPLPIGYLLSSPHEVQTDIEVINDLYALRQFRMNGKIFTSKELELGKNLHKHFENTLPEDVEQIHALPLEGSEKFYTNQGYRGKANTTWIKQLKN